MRLTRRACLGAIIGSAATARIPGSSATTASAALDRAAETADPIAALNLLRGVEATTTAERLDLEAAREGLEADALLARSPASFSLALRRRWGVVDLVQAEARIAREHRHIAFRAGEVFRSLGYREEPLGSLYRRLWRDGRFLYQNADLGRDRAVTDMNRTLANARAAMHGEFGPLPSSLATSRIHRMSRTDEAARRSGYRELPSTGSLGGYFVDLANVQRRPSWTLPSVVHHETVPGHLLQSAIERTAPPHPLRIRYTPHFAEGWAIYAEAFASHRDLHDTLGQLHWLIFRLCRARVDLGLAVSGWSTSKATDFFARWMGEPAYYVSFDEDIRRARAEPAARTAEVLAWLAIADAASGQSRADRIRFHRTLLAQGRMRRTAVRRL